MAGMSIVEGLKFLGDKLLSIVPSFLKAKQEHRERLARYCESIAGCLSNAYQELESGRIPHGRCQEMDQYMRDLRSVLGDVLPRQELEQLHGALLVSYKVEHIDDELTIPRAGPKYAELDIAAGRFRAIAQRIRSTKSTFTSP